MKTNEWDNANTFQNGMATKERQSYRAIPPHVAWPLFVVTLLVIGVSYSMWVVFASQSDGGVQVIENYYEKAVAWDEQAKLITASDALGWEMKLSYEPGLLPKGQGAIEIQFEDKEGEPITGLSGTIMASRPQSTGVVSEMVLEDVANQPGVYRQAFPVDSGFGLWDFEVAVARDSIRFARIIRKELVF